MAAPRLKGKRVLMIIAGEGFNDVELFEPKKLLEGKGAIVELASSSSGPCKGLLGGKAIAGLSLKDIALERYDAVVFVGGFGAESYFNDPLALKIAKLALNKDRIVAAIVCIAPTILANAGILKGLRASCFPSQGNALRGLGVLVSDQGVSVEGKIITARGPKYAVPFAEAIASALTS